MQVLYLLHRSGVSDQYYHELAQVKSLSANKHESSPLYIPYQLTWTKVSLSPSLQNIEGMKQRWPPRVQQTIGLGVYRNVKNAQTGALSHTVSNYVYIGYC